MQYLYKVFRCQVPTLCCVTLRLMHAEYRETQNKYFNCTESQFTERKQKISYFLLSPARIHVANQSDVSSDRHLNLFTAVNFESQIRLFISNKEVVRISRNDQNSLLIDIQTLQGVQRSTELDGLTFRHRASSIQDRHFVTLQRTLIIYLINKYISLSDICMTVHH